MRSYLAWPFKALTMGCVILGVILLLVARFIEEGMQGRTWREFIMETL